MIIAQRRQTAGVAFAGVVYAHQQGPSIRECIDDLSAIAGATELAEWENRVEYLPL